MADTNVMAMAVRYTSVATRRPLSNMLFSCLMGPIRNIVLQTPSTRSTRRVSALMSGQQINQLQKQLMAPLQKPGPHLMTISRLDIVYSTAKRLGLRKNQVACLLVVLC